MKYTVNMLLIFFLVMIFLFSETPNREDYVFLVQHQKHSSYIQMDLLISHIYDVSSSSKWEELNNIIANHHHNGTDVLVNILYDHPKRKEVNNVSLL